MCEQVASALVNKGERLGQLGRHEDALNACDDVITHFKAASEPALREQVAFAVANMAASLVVLGRYDEARAHAREALALARKLQLDNLTAVTLQHLAAVAALRPQGKAERTFEEHARAVRIMGFVDARVAVLGVARWYTEQQEYDRVLAVLRGAVGAAELADLMVAGAEMTEDQAIEEALII
jgi:tetratricopeptide (TPR) repeat protein